MTVAYLRARRGERRTRAVVSSPAEIERIARELPRHGRRPIGSRLSVLTVAHSIWRDAVRALAAVVPVVLIDVSEPTENLLWEVETLRQEPSARWVLIGDQDRVAALAAEGPEGPVSQRLATLLHGELVLAYRSGRRPMRRFACTLRAHLDDAVR